MSLDVFPFVAQFLHTMSQDVIPQKVGFNISLFIRKKIERHSISKFTATVVQPVIVEKQLKIEGFIVTRWINRWSEGITQLHEWIESGRIINRETIMDGFENLPQAFIGLLRGKNFGKALVKA